MVPTLSVNSISTNIMISEKKVTYRQKGVNSFKMLNPFLSGLTFLRHAITQFLVQTIERVLYCILSKFVGTEIYYYFIILTADIDIYLRIYDYEGSTGIQWEANLFKISS